MVGWADRLIGNIEAAVFRHTGDAMKGYRTMLVGLGFAALGGALLVFGPESRVDLAIGLIVNGAAMAGLRTITDSPVGRTQ